MLEALEGRDDVGQEALLLREVAKVRFSGHLDVEAHGAGEAHGFVHGRVAATGQDFEVDVAAKALATAQRAHHLQHALHGGVRVLGHAAGEEETEDLFAPQVVQEEAHHLLGG